MSFRRLVPILALLAVFTMALRFSIGPDTYWHLRAGDWMISEGSLLTTDPFSLTQFGSEWIYPGWVAQIAMTLTHRLLGFPGLNLLTALVVTATFGFVWMTLRGGPLLRAFVLLFAATVAAVYWSARPHIFTLLFTAVTLWALEKYRRTGSRIIWLIPALTVIWANTHGGFVIPILLIGLELVATLVDRLLPGLRIAIGSKGESADVEASPGPIIQAEESGSESGAGAHKQTGDPGLEDDLVRSDPASRSQLPRRDVLLDRLKSLVGVGLASIAAIIINPFGIDMLAYPLRTVSIGVLQDHIQEWQSPNFHQAEVQPYLWLLLVVLISMAVSPKRPSVIELLHIVVFAYLGFVAARNIALFALVAAPVLSRHLDASLTKWLPRRRSRQELPARLTRPLNLVLLVLVAVAALLKGIRPLSTEFNEETIEEGMPVRAAEYMRNNQPEGPLLNTYNWGGYVLWSLWPDYRSFVDGRTDLFNDAILEEYLEVWRGGAGWRRTLEKWGIRTVLIETDAPLGREVQREGWYAIYKDDQAIVLSAPN